MSIIERAANRLDENKGHKAGQAEPVPAADAQPTVDAQIDAVSAQLAAPIVAATPAAPAAPAAAVAPAAPPTVAPTIAPAIAPASAPATARSQGKQVEIDLARLNHLGFIAGGDAKSVTAEHFRLIKRPLIKKAFGKPNSSGNPPNLIMVTSSLPGEGKTFCSINLALSIAMELDHTVLLVDADVSRPSVLRTLEVRASEGLMNILLGEKLELADVMLKTNVDTLSILPAGRPHPHATELLASQTMSLLLEEIASRYPDRIVIFDSPPLLLTSEARVLASKMGQIVLVVEAETTTKGAVKASLQHLHGCPNVNLIYNKSRAFPGAEKYGYGYGYGNYYS